MNKPLITVLMPVYNGELYLQDAIESILNQTYRDFEFLIINDGSTDRSLDIIGQYTDPRIRLISQENAGVSAALNTGLDHALGKYIARMDCDDICMPERLSEQISFLLAHPDYVLVGSDADYIDKDGNFIFHYQNPGATDEEIRQHILLDCPFFHSSVMYLKDMVRSAGGYDTNAHLFEDYFLWIRLIKKGKVANIRKSLISYRFNPSSVTVDYKDYSKEYIRIKNKAISTGSLSDAEGQILKANTSKICEKKRLFSYHSLLGKKYLWNNYSPLKSRSHFTSALKLYPFKIRTYFYILLSLLPSVIISGMYHKVKKNDINLSGL